MQLSWAKPGNSREGGRVEGRALRIGEGREGGGERGGGEGPERSRVILLCLLNKLIKWKLCIVTYSPHTLHPSTFWHWRE